MNIKESLSAINPGASLVSIDTEAILKELDGLANPELSDKEGNGIRRHTTCKVSVKLDNKLPSACGVYEWERGGKIGFTFTFNPMRIKTQEQLERHLQFCRNSIVG